MAEHWTQIPLLKYSPGRVLYYKKKTLLKSVIHNSRTPLVSNPSQAMSFEDFNKYSY